MGLTRARGDEVEVGDGFRGMCMEVAGSSLEDAGGLTFGGCDRVDVWRI